MYHDSTTDPERRKIFFQDFFESLELRQRGTPPRYSQGDRSPPPLPRRKLFMNSAVEATKTRTSNTNRVLTNVTMYGIPSPVPPSTPLDSTRLHQLIDSRMHRSSPFNNFSSSTHHACPHTHTQTHRHTHVQTHTQTHTQTHIYTDTLTQDKEVPPPFFFCSRFCLFLPSSKQVRISTRTDRSKAQSYLPPVLIVPSGGHVFYFLSQTRPS